MGVPALHGTVALVFLVMLYSAPIAFVSMRILRNQKRQARVAEESGMPFRLPDRLPRGYGIGRVWRQYVRAVLDVRLRWPEHARQLAESVRTTGRLPILMGQLRQAEQTLAQTLETADQPELADALRWRAWCAAIRLWMVRGYQW